MPAYTTVFETYAPDLYFPYAGIMLVRYVIVNSHINDMNFFFVVFNLRPHKFDMKEWPAKKLHMENSLF